VCARPRAFCTVVRMDGALIFREPIRSSSRALLSGTGMGLSDDRWRSPHQPSRRSTPTGPSCAERVAPGPTSRPIHSRLARRRATRMPVACPGARVLVSETTAGAAFRIEVGLPASAPSAWRRRVCSRRRRPRRTRQSPAGIRITRLKPVRTPLGVIGLPALEPGH